MTFMSCVEPMAYAFMACGLRPVADVVTYSILPTPPWPMVACPRADAHVAGVLFVLYLVYFARRARLLGACICRLGCLDGEL